MFFSDDSWFDFDSFEHIALYKCILYKRLTPSLVPYPPNYLSIEKNKQTWTPYPSLAEKKLQNVTRTTKSRDQMSTEAYKGHFIDLFSLKR